VALRPGQSSSQIRQGLGEGPREVTTDLRTDAPTRRDWMWIGSGLATLVVIALVGALLLSKPRAGVAVPVPATPPAAPAQWQGTPPVPTPPSTPAPVAPAPVPPAPPTTSATAEPTPTPEPAPRSSVAAEPERTKAHAPSEAAAPNRGHGDRTKLRARTGKRAPAQAPSVPSDHRPNPFE
jgi:hypothetical protein